MTHFVQLFPPSIARMQSRPCDDDAFARIRARMRDVVVSTTAGGEDRITTGGDVAYGNGDYDNDNRHHRGGVEGVARS